MRLDRESAIEVATPQLSCPSAPPEIPGAVAFGVVDHTATPPEVLYLEDPIPVDDALLALAAPLEPREVFRVGAPCQTERCTHWSGHDCRLVERIVNLVPAASLLTPPCKLRPTCRWFAQAGRSACVRCVHVITRDEDPTDAMRTAATPIGASPE
ncbi:MAG TPA: hypothetical protein VGJ91_08210 [Polyangiaceae bacterium]|jgi:hypothetical protein